MKRSREAIIAKILDICSEGATKTGIVYQANLNFHTAVPYIELLMQKEMLAAINYPRTTYKTTQKGINFLKDLKYIRSQIPEIYDLPASEKNPSPA